MAQHILQPASLGDPDRTAASGSRIRVVLADAHLAVRRSVGLLLDREDDLVVMGEAGDLETTLRYVARHRPDVLVLDHQLRDRPRGRTIRHLRSSAPETAIVVLTMDDSAALASQALDAGASGVVLKERADDDLPPALRAAVRGEEFVSAPVAVRLSRMRDAAGNARPDDAR
jgi:DNA-binding NarL/FixJ family response regulator